MHNEKQLIDLKGIGPQLATKFGVLGIDSISDLMVFFPRRYDDYSFVQPISQIKPGPVTVKARIKQVSGRYVRRGMHITEAVASDGYSSVRLVWFNQPYRATGIKPSEDYYISGEFGLSYQRLSIQNPSIELASNIPVNTARIVPIYRETKGLKSAQIRKAVQAILPVIRTLPETLPPWILENKGFISYAKAVETMHFPDSASNLAKARQRLGFEEVFGLTLAALLNKAELLHEEALAISFDQELARNFVSHLPFTLTDAQRKVVWQIYKDLEKTMPMNRLIEGDVGSGKTVVAAMAAVMVIKQRFQVAMMAPTELLARQHAETIFNLLKPLKMEKFVSLLVGSLSAAQKKSAYKHIKDGSVRFIIGTHALIQEKVDMQKLGLVIVDEQHRFGVQQRKKLQAKAGHMPHVLHMSATPIPRSLALTLYGELDIAIIDTKPANRRQIITKLCSPNSTKQLYEHVDEQLETGRQAFIVCPLISESTMVAAKSAESVYDELRHGPYKHRRVGLLHGKMKPNEKEAIMVRFINRDLDILVATTVIEVGVDVPNATVMVIQNAERFGLAQIHQLRGRVGRSEHQGYAYLILGDSKVPSKRLKALESTSDGFKLAELDLEIRGPGAIYGTLQHGALDLRVAKITDIALIQSARQTAQEFLERKENLVQYKQLYKRISNLRSVTNLN